MEIEPVQVTARWAPSGEFTPAHMTWQGKKYTFESIGRHWEDEGGWHILCMVAGGNVFELIFRLNPAGWWLRSHSSRPDRA
jgi:hypothetical protein